MDSEKQRGKAFDVLHEGCVAPRVGGTGTNPQE